jgi:hypothetical protein
VATFYPEECVNVTDPYASEVAALAARFGFPTDETDPIMAEVRRQDLTAEPSQQIDLGPDNDQVIRLRDRNTGKVVATAYGADPRQALIRALTQVLEMRAPRSRT